MKIETTTNNTKNQVVNQEIAMTNERPIYTYQDAEDMIYGKTTTPCDDKASNEIKFEDYEAAYQAGHTDAVSIALYVCSVRVDATRTYPMISINWIKTMRSLVRQVARPARRHWNTVIRNHEQMQAHQAAIWNSWAEENGYRLKAA